MGLRSLMLTQFNVVAIWIVKYSNDCKFTSKWYNQFYRIIWQYSRHGSLSKGYIISLYLSDNGPGRFFSLPGWTEEICEPI